jgi:4-amino-4-deoxy-L-arabinose transferase-like glycosyltransferase
MVSVGAYVVGALSLLVVGGSIGFTAYRLRRKLLPAWTGAPARLVESVVALALLIWLGELLGTFGLFYAWILVIASILLATLAWALLPAGPVAAGDPPPPAGAEASSGAGPPTAPPAGPSAWQWLATIGAIALVTAHWGLTTKEALDRGIFNFDSLWYHMPFAVDMAKSHSTTGLHYVETVFTNWFYPQNSELLHATGILLTGRDTLSLFLNFAFLGLAFLAAWCIGRPYGRGHLAVIAAAILLECHTLVVREPGAAKNDLVAAALLLAAVAILVNSMHVSRGWRGGGGSRTARGLPVGPPPPRQDPRADMPWALAAAGLAAGLAVGTKSTAVAMAFGLTVAVIALAPTGRRWAAVGWWFVSALLGGGYWYLRNLIVAGNPLPQVTSIGPISLPHPERLQEGRPDFSIVHYASDTGVWRHYFAPGVHEAFGPLWPLVLAAAVAGGVLASLRGRDGMLRWAGAVALFGLVAYLFTPLTAAGAEGAPVGFGINIRYAIPPLLLGLTLLPVALGRLSRCGEWTLLAALLAVLVVTDRADAVLRDPNRLFGWALAFVLVLLPAGIVWASRLSVPGRPLLPVGDADLGDRPEEQPHRRGGGSRSVAGPAGLAGLALAVIALGYPIQRHYLRDRFAAGSEIPGMHMEAAYRWARDRSDTRIGIVGTTAGFLQYGLYGTDLSNHVTYLGEKGPHGAFDAIPACDRFRAAVNAANVEYLITAPFLNFLRPSRPIASPEARWLRGDPAAEPLVRRGPVTVWKIHGKLSPQACGPANSPLRRVPDTPDGESG